MHDLVGADHLLPTMQAGILIADKAFDADQRVLEPLAAAGKAAVIPAKANRAEPRPLDEHMYGARHLVPGRRGCYHPRPPQSRTSMFHAYGSSRESFVLSGVVVDDPGRRQRVSVEKRVETSPCEPLPPRSSLQPLVPCPHDLVAILL